MVFALARETASLFTLAGEENKKLGWSQDAGLTELPPTPAVDSLKTLEPRMVAKWTTYLQMKATFYEAYVSSSGTLTPPV